MTEYGARPVPRIIRVGSAPGAPAALPGAGGTLEDRVDALEQQLPPTILAANQLVIDPVTGAIVPPPAPLAPVLAMLGRFVYADQAIPPAAAVIPGGRALEGLAAAGIVVDALGVTPTSTSRVVGGQGPFTLRVVGGGVYQHSGPQGPFNGSGQHFATLDMFLLAAPPGTVFNFSTSSGDYQILNGLTQAVIQTGGGGSTLNASMTIPAEGSVIFVQGNAGDPTSYPVSITFSRVTPGTFTEIALPGGFLYTIAAELSLQIAPDGAGNASGAIAMTVSSELDFPPATTTTQRTTIPYSLTNFPGATPTIRAGLADTILVQPGDYSAFAAFQAVASGPFPNGTYVLTGATIRIQQLSLTGR